MPPDILISLNFMPTSHAREITIVCILLCTISWIVLALRYWTRIFLTNNLGGDDFAILLSLMLFTSFCTILPIVAYSIADRSTILSTEVTTATNLVLTLEILYLVIILFVKISLGLFFLRIIVKRWQRRVIYAVMILFSVFSFCYFWYAIFQCGVPRGNNFWMRKITGRCLSDSSGLALGYVHGVLTTLTDVIFVALPIYIVSKSSLKLREQVSVGLILLLAITGCIASMVRLKYIPVLGFTSIAVFDDGLSLAIWSALEPGLGIIASSLATLRPLFRQFAEGIRSTRNSSRGFSSRKSNTLVASTDKSRATGSRSKVSKSSTNYNFFLSKTNRSFDTFSEDQNAETMIQGGPLETTRKGGLSGDDAQIKPSMSRLAERPRVNPPEQALFPAERTLIEPHTAMTWSPVASVTPPREPRMKARGGARINQQAQEGLPLSLFGHGRRMRGRFEDTSDSESSLHTRHH